MKHIKQYESLADEEMKKKYRKIWLFPTDDRYENALNSIPEIAELEDTEDILTYSHDFLLSAGYNPDYIFIGIYNNWLWFDFSEEGFNFIERENYKYLGPVNIPEEEYENAIISLKINKYNL